ncbi:MAG: acetate--CoA ligase family protein [Novosphingobium sp.]|nr:acetate--CoA ligase family protein [Novosphingobium sp.]
MARNTLKDGRNKAYPVNARGGRFGGEDCYTDIASISDKIDMAFVVTGNVEAAMADAANADVESLVIIGSGFAEAGDSGLLRQQKLVADARARGQLILGPNNMGFANLVDQAFAFPQALPDLRVGGVGLASQSGGFSAAAMDFAFAKDVGLSHVITLGNEAMIDVVDCMNYLVEHPGCRVIALFIETIRNPPAFMDAARRAFEAGKPIVACRIGRSEGGARAVAAHTGGMATDDRIIDAVFRQHGVVRAPSIEDLLLTAAILDEYGVLPGRGIGVLSPSGAVGSIISDLAEVSGVELPPLSDEARRRLREDVLPEFATAANPLDFTAYVTTKPEVMPLSAAVMRDDADLDMVAFTCVTCAPQTEAAAPLLGRLVDGIADIFRGSEKPLVLMDFVDAGTTAFARQFRRDHGLPFILPSVEKGVPALGRAIWWSERSRKGIGAPAAPARPVARPAGASGTWSEAESRDLLKQAGVPLVPAVLTSTAQAAISAAEDMSGPVALKLVSPDIAHKSDIGGVRLHVAGQAAISDAWNAVMEAGRAVPGARVDGVLVSPMRQEGLELLVGVARDPQWGLVLAVALGGIWVEVMNDSVLRVLPVDRPEIRAMLGELKGKSLLAGLRGAPPADLDRLIDAIAAIADLAFGLGDAITAIEVNPLLVHGHRIEALDALVSWNDHDRRQPQTVTAHV